MPVLELKESEKPVLFYEKRGGGRDIVLFIHGFGLNRKSWYDIVDSFIEHSTVYMVDLIGSGHSSAPEKCSAIFL